jgi:hypothetical protein
MRAMPRPGSPRYASFTVTSAESFDGNVKNSCE